MARRIHYRIPATSPGPSDERWDEIARLQNWYNREFDWPNGPLSLRRYVVFSGESLTREGSEDAAELLHRRLEALTGSGMTEIQAVRNMEDENLVTVLWGGYAPDAWASGFTRVANCEWNAYLVCDFLLKVSRIVPGSPIVVRDEGHFLKFPEIRFSDGNVLIPPEWSGHVPPEHPFPVFALVSRSKYDKSERYRNVIDGFGDLDANERRSILEDWNWLGFEEETPETDKEGDFVDLNRKVRSIRLS